MNNEFFLKHIEIYAVEFNIGKLLNSLNNIRYSKFIETKVTKMKLQNINLYDVSLLIIKKLYSMVFSNYGSTSTTKAFTPVFWFLNFI